MKMEYELVLTWFGHVSVVDWGLSFDGCRELLAEVLFVNDGLGIYSCETEA